MMNWLTGTALRQSPTASRTNSPAGALRITVRHFAATRSMLSRTFCGSGFCPSPSTMSSGNSDGPCATSVSRAIRVPLVTLTTARPRVSATRCPLRSASIPAGSMPNCTAPSGTERPSESMAVTVTGTLSPTATTRFGIATASVRSGVARTTIRRLVVSRPITASRSVEPSRSACTVARPTPVCCTRAMLVSADANRGATSANNPPGDASTRLDS